MNRRDFCKLTGIAALAGIVSPVSAAAATVAPSPLRRCRIEVIRRECFSDLQSRYLDDPETGPCDKFSCGQRFTVDSTNIDEFVSGHKFCPKAWQCIKAHVEAVLAGTSDLCGNSPADHAVIACCSDGTRPVIFKITPV